MICHQVAYLYLWVQSPSRPSQSVGEALPIDKESFFQDVDKSCPKLQYGVLENNHIHRQPLLRCPFIFNHG
jgi:hypothetical protein